MKEYEDKFLEKMYWLWLTNIKGIGDKKQGYLLNYFKEPKNIFEASESQLNSFMKIYNIFNSKDKATLMKSRNADKITSYHDKIINMGINYITIDEPYYPFSLKNINNPPKVIYYRGKVPKNEGIKIAIVGSRKCTDYGKKVALYFANELSKLGVTIVSGMARGIDTAAHRGTLKEKGNTIAVLGCGINICYPKENINVMNEIIEKGTIISEYPINTTPSAGLFPLRNRIISGLSDGVLIVEAASKSGSLITADYALEQGRDVFAIPGRVFDKYSKGTNRLIKLGAKPIIDIQDILEEYNITINNKKENKQNIEEILEENEKMVYSCISFDPIYIDNICRKINIDIRELLLILTKLEFKGIIKQLPNKYFIRV